MSCAGWEEQINSSAGLVAPAPKTIPSDLAAPFDLTVQTKDSPEIDSCYQIFLSEGFVRLRDGNQEVPVTILRDSGAMHSFVREAIAL